MNEELDTELDNELDNEVDNEELEVEIELDDSSESGGKEEKVEKPERPWSKKDEDNEARIPAGRFSEVNNQRKEAEAKAARLEQELAQYRNKQEELAKIKSPSDIKPESYKTVDEYLAARDEAVIAQASVNAEKRFVEREQKRIIEEQHNTRMERFANNYTEAVKSNPEIADAIQYMNDNIAQHLHPQVALELLEEDLGPEIIFEFMTDEKKLNMLVTDPYKAIREIHRLGAKLTREAKAEAKAEAEKKPVNLKPMQTQAKPAAPAKVKGKTVVRKSVDDMSQSEYEAYVNRHGTSGL